MEMGVILIAAMELLLLVIFAFILEILVRMGIMGEKSGWFARRKGVKQSDSSLASGFHDIIEL